MAATNSINLEQESGYIHIYMYIYGLTPMPPALGYWLWLGEALGGSGRLGFGRLWEGLGGYCDALGGSGRLWEAMGDSGRLWEALGRFGRLWEALEGSGRFFFKC